MSALLIDAEKFVFDLLTNQLDTKYVYHNLPHTQRVVNKTKELIENSEIDKTDAENLEIAAWFHDTGFTKTVDKHEVESVKIAEAFLKEHQLKADRIAEICNLILATEMGYEVTTDLEKIITDADCAHLGSKSFFDYTSLLRKEWELTNVKKVSDTEWIEINIKFLSEQHRYHTEYALKNWTKRKEKNLSKLIKNLKSLKEDIKKFNQKQEALELKKEKIEAPERGIETMFRVALRNHITLSDIADTKANILLSVNAIIISVALSNLLPKLDNPSNTYLIYPTLVFMAFTVASIVLSVLATRPNVTKGEFTKKDVSDKKVNLLFFGNFHQMSLKDFEWAMGEMMQDKDYLYSSLTKDLYFLGLVLNRKYNLLRITYTVFMVGIIISVMAFAISFYFQGAPN